jgi:response regulator RpfG family c-di-GMP phosphodiesterase
MRQSRPPEKILMVDDEPQVLDSLRRELRGRVNLTTAQSGQEALEMLEAQGPFAVVISDFKMPGMNGVELLKRIRNAAPDTVRMMLTGYADVESTIQAVNEGNIFRFLTKPCDTETLLRALVDGIRQYRLVMAERDLLDNTVQGCVRLLTDLLAVLKPKAFSRSTRIAPYVKQIVDYLEILSNWEFETAALLSHIGFLTMPDDIINKVLRDQPLDAKEQAMFLQHPQVGAEMLSAIPRMEGVARIVAYQEKNFDGSGPPEEDVWQEQIPFGARILKVLLDFDALVAAGHSRGKALEKMRARRGPYDPAVLTALGAVLGEEAKYDHREVTIYELAEGMILNEDVLSLSGSQKLLAKGLRLSKTLIMNIRSYNRVMGVREPIRVLLSLKK